MLLELDEGMSLTEKSSGTNALSISMKLKKAINTLPQHHYCKFLSKIHLYTTPLWLSSNCVVYILLAAENQPIKKELMAITELLGYRIVSEYINNTKKMTSLCEKEQVRLNKKQLEVLQLMANGMTDKAIASEIRISFDTVKYHKKNIFKKLNVNCTIEAVIKAVKLNLIDIE